MYSKLDKKTENVFMCFCMDFVRLYGSLIFRYVSHLKFNYIVLLSIVKQAMGDAEPNGLHLLSSALRKYLSKVIP